MTDIAFSYDFPNFCSDILNGGVKVQLVFDRNNPNRVVLETRLSPGNPWLVHRNFTASGSLIVSLCRFSEGQQFRLRSSVRPASAQSFPLDAGSSPSEDDFAELADRVTTLENSNPANAPETGSPSNVSRIIAVDANGKTCSVKPDALVDHELSANSEYDIIARLHK